MGKRFSSACGFLCIGLAAMSGFAGSRIWQTGYLSKGGPAPLRFQPEHTQDLSLLPPLPGADKPADASPVTTPPISQPSAASTNAVVLSATSYPTIPGNINVNSMLPDPYNGGANLGVQGSANDLLAITPQMLVEYFRPGGGTTNSANFSVFVPVNFTPATPPSPAPGSSATYRVQ